MIYGCLARFFNPYASELKFARENNFDFMQLWYDENGLSCYGNESIENIKTGNADTIIHAVLDVYLLEFHIDKLIEYTNCINSKDIIIHPILKSYVDTSDALDELINQMSFMVKRASNFGITIHLENNSMLDPIFCSITEYEKVFAKVNSLEFLIDIAHVDTVLELEAMINVKCPKILHVADRRLSEIHEHLCVGDGDIKFDQIFTGCLKEFDGRMILELLDDKDLIKSKRILKEYIDFKQT